MESLPELKVTVYSDYICPFCYVGYHRLLRLRDNYNLKINWLDFPGFTRHFLASKNSLLQI